MFDIIDATGSGYKNDPRMRNVEAEMIPLSWEGGN